MINTSRQGGKNISRIYYYGSVLQSNEVHFYIEDNKIDYTIHYPFSRCILEKSVKTFKILRADMYCDFFNYLTQYKPSQKELKEINQIRSKWFANKITVQVMNNQIKDVKLKYLREYYDSLDYKINQFKEELAEEMI